MKEIVKKIMEVVGKEDLVFVGPEEQAGIKVIRPEEIDLYPRKYKNIIVDSIDQLDEETIKKLADMTDSLWIPFSIEKLIKKVDTTIEDMIEKKDFKSIDINEKMENLKKLSGGNVSIVNFDLPEMAVVVSKGRETPSVKGLKIEPLSSFFINLSMVEYLKSKLEEVKKEKERLEIELKRSQIELERSQKEILNWEKAMKIERREMENTKKSFRKEIVRFLKENEIMKRDIENKNEEIKEIEMPYRKEIENIKEDMEKMREELETTVFEMGLKLEEELERRKLQEKDSK